LSGIDTGCVIGVISTGKLYLKSGKKFISGKVFFESPRMELFVP
jgi:hypothetical protein